VGALRPSGSDLNDGQDFPIGNARTFTHTSRDFYNFAASRIDIFGFEIEAQFCFLCAGADKKSQHEIAGTMWLQYGRLTLRSSLPGLSVLNEPRDSQSRGFQLEHDVATLC
jgi:hypothetical protein